MNQLIQTGKLVRAFSKTGRQSGQALLEMALVTPLLLALVLGVIELGRYAYLAILVESAARAGAAYGAQGLAYSVNSDGIRAAAQQDFGNDDLTVNSSTSCGYDISGNGGSCSAVETCSRGPWVEVVSVTASAKFQPLFNYPGLPGRVPMAGKATMRVAQQ